MMTYCKHCIIKFQTYRDDDTGSVCCTSCGRVISQDVYTEDVSFVKDAGGRTHLSGGRVNLASACSESHKRTLQKGNTVIDRLIEKYGITNVSHATRYYEIAVVKGFTRGRRTNQVAAACLYVACREKEKPFMLIEFSSDLSISVYELGTVYLQLCKVLSLEEHPFVQKPVDPSLFMHRYTSALKIEGDKKKKILNTALQLAVSMKRDWIQTGRKPSGICAAAIYVSSVSHGHEVSRADVVKIVHICEATLTKRLIEFENTEAGGLTLDEFTERAHDYEKERQSCKQSSMDLKMPGLTEVVCQHTSKPVQSGFGLCKDCYMEFCGGLDGSEPPAFQRAELERIANESVEMSIESTSGSEPHQKRNDNENGTRRKSEFKANTKEIGTGSLTDAQCASPSTGKVDNIGDTEDTCESPKDAPAPASVDETYTLSDIDDSEVSCYLNNEEESRFKKIIWEQMNKEYMQEQAAKEAAAAAARKLYTGTSEEIHEAQALAAAAAEAVASKREKDKKRRALEAKNQKPAHTAAEAASQLFTKKKLSSKINYDVLYSLFGDEPSPKKNRVDDADGDGKGKELGKGDNERNDDEGEEEMEDNDDEWNYEQETDGYGYDYDANEYDED